MLPEIAAGYLKERGLIVHNDYLVELAQNSKLSKERLHLTKQVVMITGPSGAGKDTLVNCLPEERFVRWRTWTTRAEVRADEMAHDPYVRATRQEFEKQIVLGNFIEVNDYAGNLYGTHKREAEAAFADGRIPVLRIDPRGALKFNKFFEDRLDPFHEANLHHFYVIPPSMDELTKRLRERDQDPQKIKKRYEVALTDLPFVLNAHYVLISHTDKVTEAVNALTSHLQSFGSNCE